MVIVKLKSGFVVVVALSKDEGGGRERRMQLVHFRVGL
jgi:hypothetical protein